jgi:hypothetical protein
MYKRAGCGICRNIRQRSSALTYVWATGRSRSRFLFALRLVLSFGLYAMAGALDFLLFNIFFSWLVVRQRKKKFPGLTFSFAPVIHPPPASMAQYIWYLCINKVVFFYYQSIDICSCWLSSVILADFLSSTRVSFRLLTWNWTPADGAQITSSRASYLFSLFMCIHIYIVSIWIRNVYMYIMCTVPYISKRKK